MRLALIPVEHILISGRQAQERAIECLWSSGIGRIDRLRLLVAVLIAISLAGFVAVLVAVLLMALLVAVLLPP